MLGRSVSGRKQPGGQQTRNLRKRMARPWFLPVMALMLRHFAIIRESASRYRRGEMTPHDRKGVSVAKKKLAGEADNETLSRESSTDRYVKERKRRGRRKALRVFFGVVIGLLVAAAGVAWAYVNNISARLNEGVTEELQATLTAPEVNEPFYMLLLGIDRSEGRSEKYGEADSAYRTDTIILARIDPINKKITLVSIHRDTLVDLGQYGVDKINAAFPNGGPAFITEVVSEFAGVPISHYAEVDFDQFIAMVDVIGGIDVDLPVDVIDETYTHTNIPAGHQHLDGNDALHICRARHAYDAYGDGDVYRAANQRMVIGAIVKKTLTLDPISMADAVSQMASSVRTTLSMDEILSLAVQFRGLNVDEDLYSGMEPTNSKYVNSTWYEICDTEAWQRMMTRVNQGLSPYESADEDIAAGVAGTIGGFSSEEDEAAADLSTSTTTPDPTDNVTPDYSGSVLVLNGAGIDGLATRVTSSLSSQGFYAISGDADDWTHDTTLIVYNGEDHLPQAAAVNESLGGEMQVIPNDGSYTYDYDIVVILGQDAG